MSGRRATTTERTDCEHGCGTRVIIARRVPSPTGTTTAKGWLPALNFGEDPTGKVAAWHTPAGGWAGYFLAAGEELPGPQWHRHAVHECDGTRRHAQRGQWTSAIGELHRQQRRGRGKRAAANPIDGMLPGMSRINPGRTP